MAVSLGGGGGKKGPALRAEMNVTPFIDVMLVLLIIFMVAAPVATVSVKVDNPPPADTPVMPPKPPAIVRLEPNGVIFIGDDPVSKADFITVLKTKAAPDDPEERVLLSAAHEVRYKDIMDIMNLMQDAEYTKIALITGDPSEGVNQ